MIALSSPMARDLRYLVALYRLTAEVTPAVGAPKGDSVRTGRALHRRGLVVAAPHQFTNRRGRWVPSAEGLAYVARNFRVFDEHAEAAVSRAVETLRWTR